MVKVLIIDNHDRFVRLITAALNRHFSGHVDIYPKFIQESGDTLLHQNFLKGRLVSRKFAEVAEQFKDMDAYIVDVALTGPETDEIGIEFVTELEKHTGRDAKVIFISKSRQLKDRPEVSRKMFVSKEDQQLGDDFETMVAKKLQALMGDRLRHPSGQPIQEPSTAKNGSDAIMIPEVPEPYARLNKLGSKARKFIDIGVTSIFYLLIAASALIGLYFIMKELIHVTIDQQPDSAPAFLHVAEMIFLVLLPLFILFGFLGYYRSTARTFLLEGGTGYMDKENATFGMDLTKKLFLSSVISYIVIKITEWVITRMDAANNPEDASALAVPDQTHLITVGVFLALVMIYYLLANNHKHEKKETKQGGR